MKTIKYKFLSAEINHGTEEKPQIEQVFLNKSMSWSPTNEEIAKCEAYNGEYNIEDDSEVEPISTATTDDVLNVLLGVTV